MRTQKQETETKKRFEDQLLSEEEMLQIRGGDGTPGGLGEDIISPPPPPPPPTGNGPN
jgi:hypothetical protein